MVAERHRRDFGEHRFFRRDRHPAIILGWYAPSYYPYYSPYTRYYSDYDTSYLPLGTIVDMSRHGLSDHEIISAIRRSGSTYYLTTSDAAYLKENGVSESVINYMLM